MALRLLVALDLTPCGVLFFFEVFAGRILTQYEFLSNFAGIELVQPANSNALQVLKMVTGIAQYPATAPGRFVTFIGPAMAAIALRIRRFLCFLTIGFIMGFIAEHSRFFHRPASRRVSPTRPPDA